MTEQEVSPKLVADAAAFVLTQVSVDEKLRAQVRALLLDQALEFATKHGAADRSQYVHEVGRAFDVLMEAAPEGTPRHLVEMLARSFGEGDDLGVRE